MQSQRLWRLPVASCLAGVVAASVAACGSSSSDDAKGDTGSSSTTAAGPAYLKAADADLAKLYASTDGTPPATGPKAQKGKVVWEISCAEGAEGCALFSSTLKDAAQRLGWKLTVFDGKFNADNAYATGIRQAVAANADAIILNGVDC